MARVDDVTFQANVRATFDVRKFAKRASVVSLAATFFVSMAIGRQSDPLLAYFLFFLTMALVALIHKDIAKQDVLAHPALRVAKIFRPMLFAVPVVLVSFIVILLTARLPVSPGSAYDKAWPAFFAGVLVGFVEEFARFVWLQVLPYSILTANLLWVLLHPQVAILFAGQVPNMVFALFAFIFGLAMTGVMWAYETRMPRRLNESFGPIAAMVFHGGYNVLVVLWTMQIAGHVFGVM